MSSCDRITLCAGLAEEAEVCRQARREAHEMLGLWGGGGEGGGLGLKIVRIEREIGRESARKREREREGEGGREREGGREGGRERERK